MGKLSDAEFEALLSTVNDAGKFQLSGGALDKLVGQISSLDRDSLGVFLSGLEKFYDRVWDWAKTSEEKDELVGVLVSALDKLEDAPSKSFIPTRLKQLLSPKPIKDEAKKISWLKEGILDSAIGFASFVDIRPNISDDRKSINGSITSIIFEIAIRTQIGDDKSVVVQLDETALGLLEEAIEDVRAKLSLLERATLRIEKSREGT